jgi:hypothetical protein
MTNQHPITPPPELVQQWINEEDGLTAGHIATQAARWGADQELEACCSEVQWLESTSTAIKIRDRRRPKPRTLKEQALALVSHDFLNQPCLSEEGYAIIRRALEALPND